MAGTRYSGDWQTKLSALMEQAAAQRAILSILDVLNLAEAGATVQTSATFLDAMRPKIIVGDVRLVGELDTSQLQALNRVSGFVPLPTLLGARTRPRVLTPEALCRKST